MSACTDEKAHHCSPQSQGESVFTLFLRRIQGIIFKNSNNEQNEIMCHNDEEDEEDVSIIKIDEKNSTSESSTSLLLTILTLIATLLSFLTSFLLNFIGLTPLAILVLALMFSHHPNSPHFSFTPLVNHTTVTSATTTTTTAASSSFSSTFTALLTSSPHAQLILALQTLLSALMALDTTILTTSISSMKHKPSIIPTLLTLSSNLTFLLLLTLIFTIVLAATSHPHFPPLHDAIDSIAGLTSQCVTHVARTGRLGDPYPCGAVVGVVERLVGTVGYFIGEMMKNGLGRET